MLLRAGIALVFPQHGRSELRLFCRRISENTTTVGERIRCRRAEGIRLSSLSRLVAGAVWLSARGVAGGKDSPLLRGLENHPAEGKEGNEGSTTQAPTGAREYYCLCCPHHLLLRPADPGRRKATPRRLLGVQ